VVKVVAYNVAAVYNVALALHLPVLRRLQIPALVLLDNIHCIILNLHEIPNVENARHNACTCIACCTCCIVGARIYPPARFPRR